MQHILNEGGEDHRHQDGVLRSARKEGLEKRLKNGHLEITVNSDLRNKSL